jgi:hypothetical protein
MAVLFCYLQLTIKIPEKYFIRTAFDFGLPRAKALCNESRLRVGLAWARAGVDVSVEDRAEV